MAARGARMPSFRVGKKTLYLPNFSIGLCRGSPDAAHTARFKVPLWFSKFDIRDYLWHAYGVEIIAARSHVKLRPVQQGRDNQIKPVFKRWFRPRAHKFMTVELLDPFVWPEDNTSEKPFGKDDLKVAMKEQEEENRFMSMTSDTEINHTRRAKMREQAQAILSGKERWTPPEYNLMNMPSKRE